MSTKETEEIRKKKDKSVDHNEVGEPNIIKLLIRWTTT